MDVISQMKKHQWTIGGIMIAVVLILLEEESIPGVWAILLAIITLILGGLLFLHVRKLGEQRTKKFTDFAEQMGMVFSVEDEWDIGESLSAFDLFWEADITNVLYGDSEQLDTVRSSKSRYLSALML